MSIVVFAGPSVTKEKILKLLPNAIILPPAKQGDVYIASCDKPQIIILIDGFFESVPAVWHKEILYAMSIGIHVYGCSSMGALRASELHTFGMNGSGIIFEKYASELFEDDDEVALTHGPKELNYLPISRAMVDLRYDLSCAAAKGILTNPEVKNIENQLKNLWYPNRTQHELYKIAESIINPNRLQQLQTFLEQGTKSLKKLDALQLLEKISLINLEELPVKTVDYSFCKNDAWYTLINDVTRSRQCAKELDLPTNSAELEKTEDTLFSGKLRARALEHALELELDAKPWIRPAFKKIARLWNCISKEEEIQFEKMTLKIKSSSLNAKQFDQWVEREALLMAYTDQIDIHETNITDAQLIFTET